MFFESLGSLVARLGGANPDVLDRVPAAKGKFFQMGLVLLSTAGLAVVSMSFALIDGVRATAAIAIPLGFLWGLIILNIDRVLIQHMRPASDLWRTLAMVLPRLAIAGLLSIVIATPLVLRVFNSEIQAEMTKDNAVQTNSIGQIRADSPAALQLASDNKRIANDQAIISGDVAGATSPNVAAAQANLATANANLAAKRATAQDAYDQMTCELDGSRCHGASGKVGPGPRYQALKRLYDIAVSDQTTAEQAVATAQQALDAANKAAAQLNSTALTEAQAQARGELPGLIKDRDTLQAQVDQQDQADSRVQSNETGLLARVQALSNLGDKSSAAFIAHWAVAGLLFMIELLPVLVKLLTALGPPSIYDRVSDLLDDSTYDAASQQRSVDRRRIEQDSKKRREIEDDMRRREIGLGIRANAHVADKMEEILDVALEQWSDQVAQTLHEAAADTSQHAPSNGGAQTSSTSTWGGGQASGASVRAKYGLPNGGQL